MTAWSKAIDEFMERESARQLNDAFMKRRRRHLTELAEFMIARIRKKDPRSVTERDAISWRDYLVLDRKPLRWGRSKNSISKRTAQSILAATRIFFAYLENESKILLNPFQYVGVGALPQSLPREILDRDEIKRLLAAVTVKTPCGLRDRAILEVLYSSGLRRGEVTRLRIQDLDLTEGRLNVIQGKGKKDRVVPLGRTACLWVRKYLIEARPHLQTQDTDEWLWLSRFGNCLRGDDVLRSIRKNRKKAKINRRITTHGLRHTMATHMIREGSPTPFVQRILGHEDLRTTQIYTRVTVNDLAVVHQKSHPQGRRKSDAILPDFALHSCS